MPNLLTLILWVAGAMILCVGLEPRKCILQVVALCQAPFLLDDLNVGLIFPADAIERAKHYLSLTSGGLGNLLDIFYATLLWKRICDTQLLKCINLLVFYMCSFLSMSVSISHSLLCVCVCVLLWAAMLFNQPNNSVFL